MDLKRMFAITVSVIVSTACSAVKPTLGVNNGVFTSCPSSPNCVNSQASDERHSIEAIIFNGDLQQAQQRLIAIIESEARSKIVIVEKGYLLAEFRSAIFKFTDDVEFYLVEKDGVTCVDVRSASRVGYSDFGVNRKRIEKIRRLMSQ